MPRAFDLCRLTLPRGDDTPSAPATSESAAAVFRSPSPRSRDSDLVPTVSSSIVLNPSFAPREPLYSTVVIPHSCGIDRPIRTQPISPGSIACRPTLRLHSQTSRDLRWPGEMTPFSWCSPTRSLRDSVATRSRLLDVEYFSIYFKLPAATSLRLTSVFRVRLGFVCTLLSFWDLTDDSNFTSKALPVGLPHRAHCREFPRGSDPPGVFQLRIGRDWGL